MKALILLLALAAGSAEAKVEKIVSSRQLEVSGVPCEAQTMLAIFSQEKDEEALGYVEVTGPAAGSANCIGTVRSHSRTGLVRVGDRTELMDLHGRDRNLPGRYDLVVEKKRRISARYKPLVYTGYLGGETAATLAKGEFLVGLSPLFYGVNDSLQVGLTPLLAFAKIASVNSKYRFYQNEDMRFSVQGTWNNYFDIGKNAWSGTIFYDSSSNSRSMTHTYLRFYSRTPSGTPLEDKAKEKRYSAELVSINEWILPSWHRILFGPKFIAGEEKDLGLVATALFVYEHFHWAINVELNSITRLKFKDKKQLASFDFFWRI
jgi:hypothetical protein